MSEKKSIPLRPLISRIPVSDDDSDLENDSKKNTYFKKRSGVLKDVGSSTTEPKYSILNPTTSQPDWRNWMQTEGFRRFLIALFILMALVSVAFLITLLIQNSEVVSRLTNRANKIGTCHGEINPFAQNPHIYVGRTQSNQTTVVSDGALFQQFRINHVRTPSERGRPIWLTRQNEVWIPNTDQDIIEIYQSATMNLKEVISTQNSGDLLPCFEPKTGGYHPTAGQFYRGQVWVSCVGSIPGWAVFDPFTRKYEAFVPLPLSFGPFTPYDVAVGESLTVVSLLNTSITTNANLIQYSNTNFLPTILSQVVGHSPLLLYNGHSDSFLFVSSFYANEVYKLSFQTLILEYTWVNISEPWGMTTDPLPEALLIIAESGLNQLRIFLIGSPYFEFSYSPVITPIDNPANLKYNFPTNQLYVTSFTNDSLITIFETDPSMGAPINPFTMDTGPGSFYLADNAITCICDLCYT